MGTKQKINECLSEQKFSLYFRRELGVQLHREATSFLPETYLARSTWNLYHPLLNNDIVGFLLQMFTPRPTLLGDSTCFWDTYVSLNWVESRKGKLSLISARANKIKRVCLCQNSQCIPRSNIKCEWIRCFVGFYWIIKSRVVFKTLSLRFVIQSV